MTAMGDSKRLWIGNKRTARGFGQGRGRGKRPQQIVAERTTPARDGLVRMDMSRVFLNSGAFVETMIDPEDIEGLVRVDLAGSWSSHVTALPEQPVLKMRAAVARDLGQTLLDAADAADRDAAEWGRRHG